MQDEMHTLTIDTERMEFLKLCDKTVDDLMALAVRPDEEHLIAPNARWIAQAAFVGHAISFGVYNKRKAVGLISLIDPRLFELDEQSSFVADCLYVWRVMIDRDHRGQGFGRATINFAQSYASILGLNGVTLTTKDKEKGNALEFYLRCGFTPTGRQVNGEIELHWVSSST